MMMMMIMCKRLAQVPMLCVPIYNMKLAMMQKTTIFTTFSAHTKMTTEKRGQHEVFGRNTTMIHARYNWRRFWFCLCKNLLQRHRAPTVFGVQIICSDRSLIDLENYGTWYDCATGLLKTHIPMHTVHVSAEKRSWKKEKRNRSVVSSFQTCPSLLPKCLSVPNKEWRSAGAET